MEKGVSRSVRVQEVGAELGLGISMVSWGMRCLWKREDLKLAMQGFPQRDTLEPRESSRSPETSLVLGRNGRVLAAQSFSRVVPGRRWSVLKTWG